jgi:hypothetical protein
LKADSSVEREKTGHLTDLLFELRAKNKALSAPQWRGEGLARGMALKVPACIWACGTAEKEKL